MSQGPTTSVVLLQQVRNPARRPPSTMRGSLGCRCSKSSARVSSTAGQLRAAHLHPSNPISFLIHWSHSVRSLRTKSWLWSRLGAPGQESPLLRFPLPPNFLSSRTMARASQSIRPAAHPPPRQLPGCDICSTGCCWQLPSAEAQALQQVTLSSCTWSWATRCQASLRMCPAAPSSAGNQHRAQ